MEICNRQSRLCQRGLYPSQTSGNLNWDDLPEDISDDDCEKIIKIFNLKDNSKLAAAALIKAIYKKIGGNTIRNKAHLRTVIAEEITTQKS